MESVLLKVFIPTALAFTLGILITPLITHYLYLNRVWKKKAGKGAGYGGGATPLFDELHKEKDSGTPRMGGIVIWASVLLTISLMWLLEVLFPHSFLGSLNYLSRSQTWLPLTALMIGACVGFIDDLLVVRGTGRHFAGGLPLSQRLIVVTLTALFTGWWFYEKLGVHEVSFLGFGYLDLGIFFIPFFIFVAIAIYASSVIDGIDGLAGGTFMFIFTAYGGIALIEEQYDLAAFSLTITGGILAFLWFNVPPARFYMTETGMMALTMALTTIVFMTDSLGGGEGVSILPVVGFLLFATVCSDIIQVCSKKFLGRKFFLIAPLHHHFEALGWPSYKVTMRYWILGFIMATIGILLGVAW